MNNGLIYIIVCVVFFAIFMVKVFSQDKDDDAGNLA
jgi:hypothetical protein